MLLVVTVVLLCFFQDLPYIDGTATVRFHQSGEY